MRLTLPKMTLPRRPGLPPMLARMARVGGVHVHGMAAAEDGKMPLPDEPRGSGSWANEWVPLARAAGLSPPETSPMDADARHPVVPRRPGKGAPAAPPPPAAPLTCQPLLDAPLQRLHGFLCDRLEEEAPLCAVHAKTILSAFVVPSEGRAPEIADLSVDLLIVDGAGKPCMALMRRNIRSAQAEATVENALEEAGVPLHWLRTRVAPHKLWGNLRAHLPVETAVAAGDDAE